LYVVRFGEIVTDVWSSEMVCPGGCYDEWIVCLSVDRDSSTDPIGKVWA
jgi:hypothetical protein